MNDENTNKNPTKNEPQQNKPKLVSKNKIIREDFVNDRPTPGFIINSTNLSRIRNVLGKTKTPGS